MDDVPMTGLRVYVKHPDIAEVLAPSLALEEAPPDQRRTRVRRLANELEL